MAEIQWIKLAVGLFENRKIKRILAMPRGNEMLLFWIRLLCLGGRINHGGKLMFTEEVPFDAEGLAVECDLPTSLVREWLATFIGFRMMSEKEGVYHITGWEKYQSVEGMERVRELTRQRTRTYRKRLEEEKKKEGAASQNELFEKSVKASDDAVLEDALQSHVTSRDATEKEEEKEEEQEKEFHSLILPREGEGAFFARELLGGKLGRGKVLLSDAQMEDLLSRLTLEEFDHYVTVIADCEEKGKSFRRKSHYQAILEMAAKDRRVLQAKSDEVRT